MSLGLHSIDRLRFQASSPEWAFRRHDAESGLLEPRQRRLVHHLDRRLVHHRRREQSHQPVVQVLRHHWPQALRHHLDLDRHPPQVRQAQLVLQPGRNQ
jgi:hypothetical protein